MQLRIAGEVSPSFAIRRELAAWFGCLALAASASLPLFAATGQSQQASTPVLVELFTSEGCSSCPPADSLLAELEQKQPVPGTLIVVLSEHVDYWDHEGWRDPNSSHLWTDRQNEYGRQFRLDSVYTPQMVIDGNQQASGNDPRTIVAAIEHDATMPHVGIAISKLERSGGGLQVAFTAGAAHGASLFAVVADDADHSNVQRGENAGHTLDHVAVARSLVRLAKLESAPLYKTATLALPADAASRHLRLVLFAQDGKTGHIVGVTEREL